jgi:NAD(P)-dependent dehydrogenase (short-subunit alcohol dehydrogenase family)
MPTDETFLVLGGGGMIGAQVVRQVARNLAPRRVIVAALYQQEVREALEQFEREFPAVHFVGFWGDVFLRAEWNTHDRRRRITRQQLIEAEEHRADLYADLFGDLDGAYRRSQLAQLILEHKPEVIVDSINTATAISYQDVYTASVVAKRELGALVEQLENHVVNPAQREATQLALETLLISQAMPQLVRHVLLIHRAMSEAGTRMYLKVGTTGTGGMGLNIPYTHSEDKPSAKLMTKTAIAFAHTGLMFLMARTPGGPIVKEIKPGAMVGYADITRRTINDRGQPVYVYTSRAEPLGESLILRQAEEKYERLGKLQMAVVDTGENGVFARGEFEAITHLRQMEFITPEEIARQVVLEVRGSNTGYDVIGAIDSSVMNPTYRAGYLRHFALEEIAWLEKETHSHSVALGQLGPPELGKLLWEAHLLKLKFGALNAVLGQSAEALANEIYALIESDADLRQTIISVGLPILTPDGCSLIRGPYIRIPEVPGANSVPLTPESIDQWAAKGWVDLRPTNFERWHDRFSQMQREAQRLRGRGSAAVTRQAYLSDDISSGMVVGWIFNNEEDGYRIK